MTDRFSIQVAAFATLTVYGPDAGNGADFVDRADVHSGRMRSGKQLGKEVREDARERRLAGDRRFAFRDRDGEFVLTAKLFRRARRTMSIVTSFRTPH
jgi:hypothetical protein